MLCAWIPNACHPPPAARNNYCNTPFGFTTLKVKILETTLKALKAYKLAPK
jgi:hypothetical protein